MFFEVQHGVAEVLHRCLLLWAFSVPATNAQTQEKHQEVEVTVDWIRAIEPELTSGPSLRAMIDWRLAKAGFSRLEARAEKRATESRQ